MLLVAPLVVVVAQIRPAAAFQVPQTRQEFVNAVAAGGRGTTTEKFTVDRGLGEVYSLLKERSSTCLDIEVRHSGFVGNQMEVTSADYNPTLKKIGKDKVEFALQVVHRPRAIGEKAPPGGLYVMAANIRPLGGRRSEVLLYRPTIGFKKVVNSFKQWVAGEDAGCPKMR